jgi:hypothetical protein
VSASDPCRTPENLISLTWLSAAPLSSVTKGISMNTPCRLFSRATVTRCNATVFIVQRCDLACR